MATALVRPLTAEDGLQPKWIDGRPMEKVAAEFIKPNDRLTAFERLQLYGRMYWFRLYDAIGDDCPGLIAALGEERFWRLAQAYLVACPSRSFTLRNLSSRLEQFIRVHPRLTAPRTALALEIARFEWAQTVAFDDEAKPVIAPERLAQVPPGRLRLGLQSYVTLLALKYPVDRFVIAVKRRNTLRSEASNTPDAEVTVHRPTRRVALPRPHPTYLAVHRHNNRLYYKRMSLPAFRILSALQKGLPLSRALAAAGRDARASQVKAWFKAWMALGWFCEYGKGPARRAS